MGLVNAEITNFENGVNNRNAKDIFGSLGQLDPTKFHTYMEDFDYYLATDWTITAVGAGTVALTDADGGQLLLTNAAADNNSLFLNKVGEGWLFEAQANRKLYFRAKFQVSDATQSDLVAGLQITDTTPLAVTDGVYFRKDDGDALIDFVAIKDSVAVEQAGIATLVDATDITLEFYWDGIDRLYYGVDGTAQGFITPGTSLPDDEVLTISFGIQNGEAVAKTMNVDYIFVAKERD